MVCHSRAANYVLGLTELQMNRDHAYNGVIDNQLRTLEHIGLIQLKKPLDKYRRLVDPADSRADIDARARSYLHANCAVPRGGRWRECANGIRVHHAARRDEGGRRATRPPRLRYCRCKVDRARAPDRSILLERMARRGAGQMPPLATTIVDRQAVELLTEWIRHMKSPE